MLDELDPFRDGRAAERMADYINWLLEGLNAGLSRDSAMAEAAERYSAQWGKDKVHGPTFQHVANSEAAQPNAPIEV